VAKTSLRGHQEVPHSLGNAWVSAGSATTEPSGLVLLKNFLASTGCVLARSAGIEACLVRDQNAGSATLPGFLGGRQKQGEEDGDAIGADGAVEVSAIAFSDETTTGACIDSFSSLRRRQNSAVNQLPVLAAEARDASLRRSWAR
jgi:hypothetical protein